LTKLGQHFFHTSHATLLFPGQNRRAANPDSVVMLPNPRALSNSEEPSTGYR
jgi:hypothetical protein